MIPIRFCKKNILSSSITTSKRVNVILLRACKAIKTSIKKGFKISPVDQSSEIDDNKVFV